MITNKIAWQHIANSFKVCEGVLGSRLLGCWTYCMQLVSVHSVMLVTDTLKKCVRCLLSPWAVWLRCLPESGPTRGGDMDCGAVTGPPDPLGHWVTTRMGHQGQSLAQAQQATQQTMQWLSPTLIEKWWKVGDRQQQGKVQRDPGKAKHRVGEPYSKWRY